MQCRNCKSDVSKIFVDLGKAPPSNKYLSEKNLMKGEMWYPLRVLVCTNCWLVQTKDYAGREDLFNDDYAYFSSYSTSWLKHAKDYVDAMIPRFKLNSKSHVVEIAANDGYLLQFIKNRGIPCTGVEPTASTAKDAKKKGIKIIEAFLGSSLAHKMVSDGITADLAIANNVLAHVPDINDFVQSFNILLSPEGVATFEFPHLLELITNIQFDTIYHEHFSYFSFTTIEQIFQKHNLSIFDVEKLTTHGGSLRVFAQKTTTGIQKRSDSVKKLLAQEQDAGISNEELYSNFQAKTDQIKNQFLSFLLDIYSKKRTVLGYGAAAKANTFLNYAGIKPDLIASIIDRNPYKIGKFMPGSHIPVVAENEILSVKPDYVIVFPWNIKAEIIEQLSYIRKWGGRFVIFNPRLEIV